MEYWFNTNEKLHIKSGTLNPHEVFRHFYLKEISKNRVLGNGGSTTLYTHHCQGYLDIGELHKLLTERYENSLFIDKQSQDEGQNLFYWYPEESSFLTVQVYEEQTHINIESIKKEFFDYIVEMVTTNLGKAPPQGQVMMLAYDGGFYLTSIGRISCPLQRINYTDEQLRVYDSLVTDMKSNSPLGRLTLLDGLPGTGKSYFIRGLITESPGLFVFVPASLSGSITGPEITPVLLSHREREVPCVLIMEDADATLVTRQIDNVSKLSELLNISDGILGDLADVRILATTNAKKPEIDEAVLRPGRLAYHLSFEKVSQEKAVKIYNHLTGEVNPTRFESMFLFQESYSLADVYKMAREDGWVPTPIDTFSNRRRTTVRSNNRSNGIGF